MKVEAVVFVDRLAIACERVKVNTVVWGLDNWKVKQLSVELGKTTRRVYFVRERQTLS